MRQSHATCFNCLKGFASDKLLQEHRRECRPSIRHARLLERVIIRPPEPQQQVQPPAPPMPAPIAPQQDVPEQAPVPVAKPVLETAPAEPVVGCPGRPHVCEYCNRDFQKVSHMHMHQSQKHRDKTEPSLLNNPVTCDQCDKEFASQADLEQHADTIHPAPEPEPTPTAPEQEPAPPATVANPIPPQPHHVCCTMPNCDFFGYIEEDLHKHLRWRHPLVYKYRCNRCAFVTDESNKLGMHHAHVHLGGFIDIGEGMFLTCDLCTTLSYSWHAFFSNIRKHKTNKYPCNECQWVFNSPQRLNNHCVSTHDTRHFGCGYCLKDFKNNTEACAHLREHQIECILCTEMFLTEEDYNRHMSEEHPDNPLTIDEMRTEEEQRDLDERRRRKMEKQEHREAYKANIEKEKKRIKKDRKRKAQPDPVNPVRRKRKNIRQKTRGMTRSTQTKMMTTTRKTYRSSLMTKPRIQTTSLPEMMTRMMMMKMMTTTRNLRNWWNKAAYLLTMYFAYLHTGIEINIHFSFCNRY